MGSRDNTYTYSKQKAKRRLFTPDEILRSNPSTLKCFCNGLGVMELNKFDYSRHHAYMFIVKSDINEYEPERRNKPEQEDKVMEVKPVKKEEKGFSKIVKIDDIRNV